MGPPGETRQRLSDFTSAYVLVYVCFCLCACVCVTKCALNSQLLCFQSLNLTNTPSAILTSLEIARQHIIIMISAFILHVTLFSLCTCRPIVQLFVVNTKHLTRNLLNPMDSLHCTRLKLLQGNFISDSKHLMFPPRRQKSPKYVMHIREKMIR